MLYFGMILGLPPFWETFMGFPCCWVFVGGYTNKLPSKIGYWTKLDGRKSKTCFLHPQDHSTLSQGFRCFFCCIVTAGFHISRLTWEIPWEFLGPMVCDDPNMDGIIDQHFDHFSSALLSTFTQRSKHQKC